MPKANIPSNNKNAVAQWLNQLIEGVQTAVDNDVAIGTVFNQALTWVNNDPTNGKVYRKRINYWFERFYNYDLQSLDINNLTNLQKGQYIQTIFVVINQIMAVYSIKENLNG